VAFASRLRAQDQSPEALAVRREGLEVAVPQRRREAGEGRVADLRVRAADGDVVKLELVDALAGVVLRIGEDLQRGDVNGRGPVIGRLGVGDVHVLERNGRLRPLIGRRVAANHTVGARARGVLDDEVQPGDLVAAEPESERLSPADGPGELQADVVPVRIRGVNLGGEEQVLLARALVGADEGDLEVVARDADARNEVRRG